MIRVLLLGAGGTAGINFTKSLRMTDDYYIVGTDMAKYNINFCPLNKTYRVPACTEPNYTDIICEIIKDEEIDFVHAQPDIEVEQLGLNSHMYNAKTFLPTSETINICRNKLITSRILSDAGIKIPTTYSCHREDLEDKFNILIDGCDRIWVRAVKGSGSKASLPVRTYTQLTSWMQYWVENKRLEYSEFAISEFLPGDEYAFQSVWKNGELITSMARRRVEYFFGNIMPSGQSSTPSVAVTVHNDELNQLCYNAVKLIDDNASGVFCIDCKTNSDGDI